eukprot:2747001-Rhodomonas_salina.1
MFLTWSAISLMQANETKTVVKRIRLDKLGQDSKLLTFSEKMELARAGFLPFPEEEELVLPTFPEES